MDTGAYGGAGVQSAGVPLLPGRCGSGASLPRPCMGDSKLPGVSGLRPSDGNACGPIQNRKFT